MNGDDAQSMTTTPASVDNILGGMIRNLSRIYETAIPEKAIVKDDGIIEYIYSDHTTKMIKKLEHDIAEYKYIFHTQNHEIKRVI